MGIFSFWDFTIKYVKFKYEKAENTTLSEKKLGKFVFHKIKKNKQFAILPVNYFTIYSSGKGMLIFLT